MSITFLLGGARSGKSALAVEIGRRHDGPWCSSLRARPLDEDLAPRIARHRRDRPDWPTIEEPLELGRRAGKVDADALVDRRLPHALGQQPDAAAATASRRSTDAAAALLMRYWHRRGPAVVVSNEVGFGVHPESELGLRYRDLLGRVNQIVAAAADTTLLHRRRTSGAARRPVDGARVSRRRVVR